MAGGMPLAFTQEDFLVRLLYHVSQDSIVWFLLLTYLLKEKLITDWTGKRGGEMPKMQISVSCVAVRPLNVPCNVKCVQKRRVSNISERFLYR